MTDAGESEDGLREDYGPHVPPTPPVGADETRHNITESADKIQLSTKIKRGDGTRDQDEIKVKVKDDDPQEAAEKLHETVVAIGEQGTVNALRGTQPSDGDGDE